MGETPMWRRYLRFLGSDPAADVEDELAFHLSMRVEDLMRGGLSGPEARAQAEREFGDVGRVRRELQAMGRRRQQRERRAQGWTSTGQDFRFALRTIKRSPGFATVVVATLALGIGGTTAVFSVVNAVLLAPLPYEEPGELVRFYQHTGSGTDALRGFLTGPHFKHVREHAASFESVGALLTYDETGLDLAVDGRPERLRALRISSDYFPALRAGAVRGRGFDRDDEAGLADVVLSDELWRRRFAADPSVIGSTVRLSAEPYSVVGVAPPGLEDPLVGKVDVWLPLDLADANHRGNHFLSAIGRLRNGVTVEQARAELGTLNRSLAEEWPEQAADTLILLPLKQDLVGASQRTLHVLSLAVALVLLVACANVANLFLVRATGRVREFAIRSALGSGGVRIARQLLVESLVLAALGGLFGLALAVLGVEALRMLGHGAIPRLDEVSFDPAVLGFTALATLATGIAFGMAPALRAARIQPSRALREQSRSATGSRGQGRLRNVLAAAQLALALTLLAGAGVLMDSYLRLQQLDLGFRTERLLTFEVSLPAARYDAARRATFQEELARQLERIPGVTAAGGISRLPATGPNLNWYTYILSGPLAGREEPLTANQRIISGNLFEALEVPLLAGRVFDEQDDTGAPARVVISAALAREAFPGLSVDQVVGQRIAPSLMEREIIGVVGDVAVDVRGTRQPLVYHTHRQFADDRNWVLSQVVATELPPERILADVRGVVAALDPELVVHRPAPITEVLGRGVSRERFVLALMGAFAAVALTLAALGLYGVLAYAVRLRTQEIGIRIALGATAAHVCMLVVRHAAAVVGFGMLGGLAGALMLGRWLAALLFETSPWDPRMFVATATLLSVVALLSTWLPARRAARVEPRIALEDT